MNKPNNNPNRGGKRAGAGRKPIGQTRKISLTLPAKYNIQTAERLLNYIVHARIVRMNNASHLPFVAKPEEFNQTVFEFLLKNTPVLQTLEK